MTASPSPAELALLEAGLPFRRLEYIYHERGGTADAAAQLGVDEYRIIKSLVFDDAGPLPERGVMALIHGTMRVSLRKLERLAAMPRLAPSSPENALRFSGYRPGGICPFRLAAPLPVFIQASLLELDVVFINAGERGVVVEISPDVLRCLGAVPGDFAGARS